MLQICTQNYDYKFLLWKSVIYKYLSAVFVRFSRLLLSFSIYLLNHGIEMSVGVDLKVSWKREKREEVIKVL